MNLAIDQLRQFLEYTPAAVAMFDRDICYLATSRRWLHDYRLQDTNIIGRSHYEIFPEIPEHWREVHRRALEGAIEQCDEEAFERQDGRTDWVRWSVVPWRTSEGSIGGILMLTEVISERKELEARLARSEKNAALGRLVGGVAHDFNNLLSVILGNADLAAASQSSDPELRHSLAEIQRAAGLASQLTSQLMAFGRAQRLKLAARAFDQSLERSKAMIEALLPPTVEVRWRLRAAGVRVSFDETLITTALLNLVLNARDAMRAGGTLTLGSERVELRADEVRADEPLRAGPHLRCQVTDTGVGMDSALLRQVCEPYFTTQEGGGRGKGLGLASVLGVVEQHGGALRISSAPGRGTAVSILLPITEPSPEPDSPADPLPTHQLEPRPRDPLRGALRARD